MKMCHWKQWGNEGQVCCEAVCDQRESVDAADLICPFHIGWGKECQSGNA
jgi:hypothetical protein